MLVLVPLDALNSNHNHYISMNLGVSLMEIHEILREFFYSQTNYTVQTE